MAKAPMRTAGSATMEQPVEQPAKSPIQSIQERKAKAQAELQELEKLEKQEAMLNVETDKKEYEVKKSELQKLLNTIRITDKNYELVIDGKVVAARVKKAIKNGAKTMSDIILRSELPPDSVKTYLPNGVKTGAIIGQEGNYSVKDRKPRTATT